MTIDAFFESLIEEYKKLNNQQSKQAIKQIESIKIKVFELLAKYADKDGNIPRSKNRAINRELEAMLPDFHKEVSDAIEQVINDTTSWTTDKVIEFFAVTFGVSLIAASAKEALNKEVINNVYKHRWSNGTNLTDIQYWHARDLLDSIRRAVNAKSKAGLSEALKEVEKALKANRWKTENIVKSDGVNAYRESIVENAKKSKYVEAVHITEGIHHSPKCVALARADHYGLGEGVYPPDTSYPIDRPHPRCTSFLTYVMKPRRDGLFDDY